MVQGHIQEREDGPIDFLGIDLHGSDLRDVIELVGLTSNASWESLTVA